MSRSAVLLPVLVCAALATAAPAQTAAVNARAETVPVGTANDDAADDPAIWRNPRRPSASLIVGTDKKAGLYVYGLDGKVRSFTAAGRVNNVDLVDLGRRGVIVVASDRNDEANAKLVIYRLDTRSGALIQMGVVDGGSGEAYGVCLMRKGRQLYAFSVLKHGAIHQVRLDPAGGTFAGAIVRSLQLASQTEGCVADTRTDMLYVGEENRGVWAFDARPGGAAQGRLVAPVDGRQLVADVEGLALMPQGRRGGWLIASSQGDNAFALYSLPSLKPAGRFRVSAGTFGSVEETDGIEIARGSFGRAYTGGLFVAQDGHNAPYAQNFKLLSWRDIRRALRQLPGEPQK